MGLRRAPALRRGRRGQGLRPGVARGPGGALGREGGGSVTPARGSCVFRPREVEEGAGGAGGSSRGRLFRAAALPPPPGTAAGLPWRSLTCLNGHKLQVVP